MRNSSSINSDSDSDNDFNIFQIMTLDSEKIAFIKRL